MDSRSAPQSEHILEHCRGDPALLVNCNGEGPISAEWMTPKALWIKEMEPEVWKNADIICEYQDYVNYRLTGIVCASSCNAAVRWHWDGEECVGDGTSDEDDNININNDNALQSLHRLRKLPGRPHSLYEKLGMPELADKLPQKCVAMGGKVGGLTVNAAKDLGLPEGLTVAQVGLSGLDVLMIFLITFEQYLVCNTNEKNDTDRIYIISSFIIHINVYPIVNA